MHSVRYWTAVGCGVALLVAAVATAQSARPETSPAPKRADAPFIVVLDAGHGGRDSGARFGGLDEAALVLSFAAELAAELEAEGAADVVMTRRDDAWLSLDDRRAVIDAAAPDLVISLQADALPGARHVSGVVLYAPGGGASVAGADCVRASRRFAEMSAAEIAAVAPVIGEPVVRHAAFYLMRDCEAPTVIVSLGFLTSAEDRARFEDPAWRGAVRGALASSIQAFAAQ